MKTKFTFMILLSCFLLLPARSIGNTMNDKNLKITGKVVDTDENLLPYTTVRLLNTDSVFIAGTITDTLGVYQFETRVGEYLLSYSSVGYKSLIQPITVSKPNMYVPTIKLESDNVMLNEVVVKASAYIRKKDHILVVPDKKQVKHASTGYDLLYNLMIPEIDVNKRTGEVSTLGGSVALYINGEKASYRDVQSLRPRDIENVEYYDVPTGKYANDVAAINYITKQITSGGYTALDAKQTIGYLAGDYNVSAKLNHNNTAYSFWGGYNMKDYDGVQAEKHENIVFPDYAVNRDRTTNNANFSNNQQYMQFKVANTTPKRNLSAYASLVRNHTPENESNDMLNYSGHYNRDEKSTESTLSKNIQPTLNLYGNFNLPKNQNLEFSMKASYTKNDYDRSYAEEEYNSTTSVDEDMYVFEASGKYNVKLKHNNSLGVWGYHLHKITSSSYSGDYESWQHLWSGESLLFLNYTQNIGKKIMLNVSPGYSLLNYKLHSDDLMKQHSFRLKTNLVYRMNQKHQLVFAANIGNNTPNISYKNSVDQTVDFLQIKRGNPNLKNAKIYTGNIVYGGQFGRLNLQAIAVYEFSKNGSFANYYIENDKLISTYSSDANVHAFMFQVNAAYRFSDNLRMKLSGGHLHMEIPKLSNLTNDCYFGSFDLNYYWKDLSFNIYSNASTSRLSKTLVFTKSPVVYGLSLSWSKKGWYSEIGMENPFTKESHYKEHADYGVYAYNRIQTSRIYQQTGYVKLAYTFDFGKKAARERKNIDTNINSAILKAN